jgi:hypothetical protein
MRGQDVPHLHGEKKVLQDYKVLVNGCAPVYNFDGGDSEKGNNMDLDKGFDSNNLNTPYLDAEYSFRIDSNSNPL